MQPLCKVSAIPHKQFLVGRDGLDSVEVDVHSILTGCQVLFLNGVAGVYITHPVALVLVKSINEVVKLTT